MSSSNFKQFGSGLAVTYILLVFLNLPLFSPFAAQDLLAPLLAGFILWHWRAALLIIKQSKYTLPAFLLLAFLTSVYHSYCGNGSFYDFSVFAYMGMLYLFFRLNPLEEKVQVRLGFALLCLLLGGFCLGLIAVFFPNFPGYSLFYHDSSSADRGLALLAMRYQALFPNPNLLGSFYVLPVILLRPWLQKQFKAWQNWRQCLLFFGILALCLLPLVSSASKHALMTLAVLTGILLEAWPEKRRILRVPACTVLILFGALCLLTVLLPTFPLSKQFPYINTSCQGNYTIHQEIYLKMLVDQGRYSLIGIGSKALRENYPKFADRKKIVEMAAKYNTPHWVEPFATFMDPHHEYLNLATLFGLPALFCCLTFWLFHCQKKHLTITLFVLAVLVCCLWDDLLSKRWLWVSLALLVIPPFRSVDSPNSP
ncbi:MAG: hypothetical protein WCT05_02045 [Lentisphaeria bacterium]